jgi:hypothetical protein
MPDMTVTRFSELRRGMRGVYSGGQCVCVCVYVCGCGCVCVKEGQVGGISGDM